MISPSSFLSILWVIFLAYWLISALRSKRTIRNDMWWRGAVVRIIIFILIIWFFSSPNIVSMFIVSQNAYFHTMALNIIGIILWFIGIGLAVWARIYLGKNWGMPMSLKENPELVMGGPYHYIRHPIYSGMLLAMLGFVLVGSFFWIIWIVFFGIYFVYSAIKEEKIMAREFPDTYPAYKKRTKMLIPFVF